MIKKRIEAGLPLEVIHCEICQEDLNIEYGNKIVCRECDSLKQRVKVYWPHMLLCVIFITLTLGGMGLLAYFQLTSNPQSHEEEISLKAIFIVGWVFLSVSLIIWIVKIFRNFLLRK